jgi:hypothetical protein
MLYTYEKKIGHNNVFKKKAKCLIKTVDHCGAEKRTISQEELHRRNASTGSEERRSNDAIPAASARSAAGVSDSESDVVRTSPGNLLDDRNYDERVGEGEHLAHLRINSRRINNALTRCLSYQKLQILVNKYWFTNICNLHI